MIKRIFQAVLCVAMFISGAAVAATDFTKDDAVKMVNKAAAFHKANGKEKFLAEANSKTGQFRNGEFYVVVMGLTGDILAHPINQKIIGKNFNDLPDIDGKFFRREIVSVAAGKGSGWVDYKYTNPENHKAEAKTSYILKVEDMILVCGIYKH